MSCVRCMLFAFLSLYLLFLITNKMNYLNGRQQPEDTMNHYHIEKLGKTIYFLQDLYGSDLVNKVFESITAYRENCLKKNHISYLPIDFIKSLSYVNLMSFWDELSPEIKNDKDFIDNLPCFKHYNILSYNGKEIRDQIDGPPTKRKNCFYCKYEQEINPEIKFEPFIPDYLVNSMEPDDILRCYKLIHSNVAK